MIELFYTHSTNLCAYLIMNGFDVKAKQKDKNKTTFYFERSKELHECIQDYNNDEKIKQFISAFKKVKEIINN